MELPKRKPNRINGFGYSSCGAYFITIWTADRKNLFWVNVGANCVRRHKPDLSEVGKTVENELKKWSETYGNVSVEKYVIMTNHIHLIVEINADEYG